MAASWETGDSGALAAPHPTPWALSPHVPSTIPVTPTVVRAPGPPAGPLHRAGVWTPVVHCLQGTAGTGKHIRKLTPSPRTPAPAHPTNKSGHPGPAGGTDPPTLWKALPTTHATRGVRAGLSPDAEPDGTSAWESVTHGGRASSPGFFRAQKQGVPRSPRVPRPGICTLLPQRDLDPGATAVKSKGTCKVMSWQRSGAPG